MRINEVDQPVTQAQIDSLETVLDRVFAQVGIDVEFTRHFLDRVNDERNVRQITIQELAILFKKEFQKYAKPIAQMGPDAQAVMKDMSSDINLPFVLNWNSGSGMLELVAKTVMRKKDFKSSNKEFAVENDNQSGVYKDEKNNVEIHWQRSNHPNVAKDYLDIEAYQNGKPVDINNQQADYYRYLINQEMNENTIAEDFGSLPPLAELIIMAVVAKTSVDVLVGMFKVALKTGKGLQKLNQLRKRVKSTIGNTGQRIADYAIPQNEDIPPQREKFMQAALDALHRLVTSKGNKQSIGGYAFDIARAFNGVNAKELEAAYNQKFVNESTNTFKKMLMEGGSMPGVGAIHIDEIEPTLRELEKSVGVDLVNNALGSVGKREFSGDIDVALKIDAEQIPEFVEKLKANPLIMDIAKSSVIMTKVRIANYDEEKSDGRPRTGFVQVDFMPGDPDWLKTYYHSPHEKDSKYKGVYRNIMIAAIAASFDINNSPEQIPDGRPEVSERWMWSPTDGLIRVKRTPVPNKAGTGYTKKNKNVIISGPFKSAEEIAQTLNLDGPESLDSFETLLASIKKNYSPELQTKIVKSFMDNGQIQSMGIPDELK